MGDSGELRIMEYGGYFPIELGGHGGELFRDSDGYEIRRLNSGRTAIYVAAMDAGTGTAWLPAYLCSSVRLFLNRKGVKVGYYNIGKDFLPERISIKGDDIVVWPNYYGVVPDGTIDELVKCYPRLIIDNTQAFYEKPRPGTYNVYSPRKFLGVSDGAYLVSDSFLNAPEQYPESDTLSTIEYMIKALGTSTNEAYPQSIENEERVEKEDVMCMSRITQRILWSVDYTGIKDRRRRNFKKLHLLLNEYNEFDLKNLFYDEAKVPMAYPFLKKNDDLRKHLVERQIYVPQWWKAVIDDEKSNEWERYLSKYMIPLPIDQRYDEDDMEYIASVVKQCIS